MLLPRLFVTIILVVRVHDVIPGKVHGEEGGKDAKAHGKSSAVPPTSKQPLLSAVVCVGLGGLSKSLGSHFCFPPGKIASHQEKYSV